MILSYTRTIILYLVLIAVIRLMGKRQIGEMEPAEFVVTMLVANLAAIPMQDSGIPLLTGLVPILTCWGWSWCCPSSCSEAVSCADSFAASPRSSSTTGSCCRGTSA